MSVLIRIFNVGHFYGINEWGFNIALLTVMLSCRARRFEGSSRRKEPPWRISSQIRKFIARGFLKRWMVLLFVPFELLPRLALCRHQHPSSKPSSLIFGVSRSLRGRFHTVIEWCCIPNRSLQVVERTFFSLRVLARNLNPNDDKWGPQILYFINSLPVDTAIQLRLTVVELIGQLAQWLKMHPEFIESVLSRLVNEIQVCL